ncbi:MAG: hypothetical protein N2652_08450 [Kiritimatiellae bacterium]|nr:hypothetical protein [Kiritimatiellia bacterium]
MRPIETDIPGAPRVPDEQLEKYSSAATLSDMEIFVFPELLYSLVLANLMSPRVWSWREDPWFQHRERLTPYRRVLRLRQFIMDRFEFNLDLDTWGLTTQARELARFRRYMDEETIARSNALFGYEGDRYYFDLDIRRHFGLDKYSSDTIPYWKTETVEAMEAFRYRPGYTKGAGECVSLSTLYVAGLFLICGVPLEDIFLMGTPLHSQNFVLLGDGLLTNNRRVVTRAMWFNGTELTRKAQRALRHEQVTVVAHCSGWIHCVYPEATMDEAEYRRFAAALRAFLHTDITMEVLLNFLREAPERQTCFQLRHTRHGRTVYLPAETAYRYEASSSCRISDRTRESLLAEIEDDEFFPEPLPDRVLLDDVEAAFRGQSVDPTDAEAVRRLIGRIGCRRFQAQRAIEELVAFAHVEPRLPDRAGEPKRWVGGPGIRLRPEMSREELCAEIARLRATHPIADLAFYAYRDLSTTDWRPFVKAAIERSPVSIAGARELDDESVVERLRLLPDESIYDGARCAQPDEVWNFGRGDGFEKALCAANILYARHPDAAFEIEVEPDCVRLTVDGVTTVWPSRKGLRGRIRF